MSGPVALRERTLVLLGAGPTHLRLLRQLAKQPLPGLRITLLTAQAQVYLPARLPGFIAGEHGIAACAVAADGLAGRSGVRLVAQRAGALDAASRTLTLDNGDHLAYDFLSLDPEPVQDRAGMEAAMPGAREHGLFLCPVEAFTVLWPRTCALPAERLRSVAVVGAGTLAVEVAFAVRQVLPQCAISLVAGGEGFFPSQPEHLRAALRPALQRASINLLEDSVLALGARGIRLGCGADLVCDVPVIATDPLWPPWLLHSGLATDGDGRHVATDECLRATSHAEVFVAPLNPGAWVARSLHANLRRVAGGLNPRPVGSMAPNPQFVDLGNRRALAQWHSYCFAGHLAWRWKKWRDRNDVGVQ